MGLDRERMGHAISLAVVPNVALGQTRVGELSMWKGMAGPQGPKPGSCRPTGRVWRHWPL